MKLEKDRESFVKEILTREIESIRKDDNYYLIDSYYQKLLALTQKVESSKKKFCYKTNFYKIQKRCPSAYPLITMSPEERADTIKALNEAQCERLIKKITLLEIELKEPIFLITSIREQIADIKYKLKTPKPDPHTIYAVSPDCRTGRAIKKFTGNKGA